MTAFHTTSYVTCFFSLLDFGDFLLDFSAFSFSLNFFFKAFIFASSSFSALTFSASALVGLPLFLGDTEAERRPRICAVILAGDSLNMANGTSSSMLSRSLSTLTDSCFTDFFGDFLAEVERLGDVPSPDCFLFFGESDIFSFFTAFLLS